MHGIKCQKGGGGVEASGCVIRAKAKKVCLGAWHRMYLLAGLLMHVCARSPI